MRDKYELCVIIKFYIIKYKYLILFMDYNIIFVYFAGSLWLSRPIIRAGCAQCWNVLLGTHHIFHHIASGVAKFNSPKFL
jgi:hypothetical protein